MKLIIQIPCLNEEDSLPSMLAELPKTLAGVDQLEVLVIDDGSSDRTSDVARALGVDYVVRHTQNMGLAKAFMTGIDTALIHGADLIVNTDADNQYCAADIQKLIQPVLEGRADFVIGSRPISEIRHFSPLKRALQKIGSWSVRVASGTSVEDAPSGFRAFNRKAAQSLFVTSNYTYTLETIIQAGHGNLKITSVPIRVNGETRPSRLVKNIFSYVRKSLFTILRVFVLYSPFKSFAGLGIALFGTGFLVGGRFLYFLAQGQGQGHVQSLILAALLMILGFQSILVAFVADLLAANRKILQDIRRRLMN